MHDEASPVHPLPVSSQDAKAPRPISVWLLFITLLVLTVLGIVGSARFFLMVATNLDKVPNVGVLNVLMAMAWRVLVLAACVVVTHGVFRGKPWARWLGLLLIALLGGYSVLGPDTTVYANDAERQGGMLGRLVLLPMLLFWWAYAFGFSAKARRFFSRRALSPGR